MTTCKRFAVGMIVGLALSGCLSRGEVTGTVGAPPPTVLDQLTRAFVRHCEERGVQPAHVDYVAISGIEVTPNRNSNTEFVAVVDMEKRWWGMWCSFQLRDGKVCELVWGEDHGAFFHAVTGTRDRRYPGLLVHAWSRSHQGNGSYRLHHVHEGRIETLIDTRGVDDNTHGDGVVLAGEALHASFDDLNADGHADVVLTGLLVKIAPAKWDEETEDSWQPVKPAKVRKVFLWNLATRAFERCATADLGSFD